MTNKFTNFNGDNLDNYLGHEMIEIKENYVKLSKIKENKSLVNYIKWLDFRGINSVKNKNDAYEK